MEINYGLVREILRFVATGTNTVDAFSTELQQNNQQELYYHTEMLSASGLFIHSEFPPKGDHQEVLNWLAQSKLSLLGQEYWEAFKDEDIWLHCQALAGRVGKQSLEVLKDIALQLIRDHYTVAMQAARKY